jgi:hypothetical protein
VFAYVHCSHTKNSSIEIIRMQRAPIAIKTSAHPALLSNRGHTSNSWAQSYDSTHGQYDICFAMNILSKFSAVPRQGHLERVFHLVGFLHKCPDRWVKIDSSEPTRVEGEEPNPGDERSK